MLLCVCVFRIPSGVVGLIVGKLTQKNFGELKEASNQNSNPMTDPWDERDIKTLHEWLVFNGKIWYM